MVEPAGQTLSLRPITAAAQGLESFGESLADKPRIHDRRVIAGESQPGPMLFAVPVDVVNGQVIAAATAGASGAVVVADLLAHGCVDVAARCLPRFGVGGLSGALSGLLAFWIGGVPGTPGSSRLFGVAFTPGFVAGVAAGACFGVGPSGAAGGVVSVAIGFSPSLHSGDFGGPVFGGIFVHVTILLCWRDRYERDITWPIDEGIAA